MYAMKYDDISPSQHCPFSPLHAPFPTSWHGDILIGVYIFPHMTDILEGMWKKDIFN